MLSLKSTSCSFNFYNPPTMIILSFLNGDRIKYRLYHFIHNPLSQMPFSLESNSFWCHIARQLEGNLRTVFFKSTFTIQMKEPLSLSGQQQQVTIAGIFFLPFKNKPWMRMKQEACKSVGLKLKGTSVFLMYVGIRI